jgi:ABC-type Fe3+-hydroxamate transport system substrate-binding protein
MSGNGQPDTRTLAGAASRRDLLLGGMAALSLAFGAIRGKAQAALPRVVVFDWGLAETLLALGVSPVALSEAGGYREWVVEPVLPPQVADAGLRIEPNFELIAAMRPDLILVTPELEPLRSLMERIARTETLAIYQQGGNAWDHARNAATAMAKLLGREVLGENLLRQVDATITTAKARLGDTGRRPIYLVNFIDRRHVRIYGQNSIFQAVLDRLGLVNAYTGWTSFWGFVTLGIEHLAANPEAQLIYLEPLSDEIRDTLKAGPLWSALPFVRDGRVSALPPVWSFGGVASGERLARLLGEKLGHGAHAAESGKAPS